MKIENAVVLITGANRGIGLAFARALLARGARKVYAGARDPSTITQAGVEPLQVSTTPASRNSVAFSRTTVRTSLADCSRPTSSACCR